MRCKDIELLIIDSSERSLSEKELLTVKMHNEQCASCARFQEDLENIRLSLKKLPFPPLRKELEQRTRDFLLAEINSLRTSGLWPARKIPPAAVPKLIWAALFALVVLTVIILIPSVKELTLDSTLSFQEAGILTLILQNAAMLIFSPILIRKFRAKIQGLRIG